MNAKRAVAGLVARRPFYPVLTRLPRTTLLAAKAAFRTGRDDLLEATLDRLVRRRPSVAARVLRADLRTFQGRDEEALLEAEAAAQHSPDSAAAAARVVKLGYRVRPREQAESAAVAAVRRFPFSAELMWQVAMACDRPQQYERVAAAWREAVDADPASGFRVLRQLGVAANRAGKPEAATDLYREAIGQLLRAAQPEPRRTAKTRLAGLGAGTALTDLTRALDGAGIRFFFAAGTALGLVREGRPLGADSDLDLGIFDPDWDRAALVDLFTSHPRFDLDLHPQTQKVGLRHRGGSPVDIFRFYEDGGRVWHDGVFVRWHNTPFEVRRQEIGGLALPLPADTDRYLTENYGDWRTPRPGFDAFTDDAPNLEVTWPAYQRMHLVRRGYERLAGGDAGSAARELDRADEPDLADQVRAGARRFTAR